MEGEKTFQLLLAALALVLVQVIFGLIKGYKAKSNGDHQQKMHEQMTRDIEFLDRQVKRAEVEIIDMQKRLREVESHGQTIVVSKGSDS